LAGKYHENLSVQRGIVNVRGILGLEEKVQQVFPVAVRGYELDKIHNNFSIPLIQHQEEIVENLALPLSPAAPACVKGEDKEVLDELGVALGTSFGDDVRYKCPDAGHFKPAPKLVEESEECVPESLHRQLSMPVFSASNLVR
jgi:hypothetical protein